MKKNILIMLCFVLALTMVLPLTSYAREASDTALYVNSDTVDIYSNAVRKEYGKSFSSMDEFGTMAGWTTLGTYSFSDELGMVFNNATANAIMDSKEFGGKYTVKYSFINKAETMATAYFNYSNNKNYYSLDVDSYDGLVTLKKVVNSSSTTLGTKVVDALVATNSGLKFDFEISVDNGDNISAWYIVDGEKVSLFENVSVTGNKLTSGKIGVAFNYNHNKASIKAINVYRMPEEDIANVANIIRGKIVTYKDAGSAVVAVAFYDGEKLIDIFTNNVSLNEGINDFTVNVQSKENLVGKNIKYFLFDNLSNITPLIVEADNSSYRNEGFSDELEPYYPMASASTKTVDEMYSTSTSSAVEKNMIESEKADRRAVIEMYKKAGFDVTADVGTYLGSRVLRAHAPQTYSTLTPKPLMGTYDHPYSIDAPWNNPIPKDNPRTEITTWTNNGVSLQMSIVRPKGATSGNGLGIPHIIADENDGFERFANKYSTNTWTTIRGALVRVPENYGDLLNNISLGDRHAVFIDDTTKHSFQTWQTVPSNTSNGYNWTSGLVRDFDARAGAVTSFIDLTGMANEAHAGVNAAGVPMDAITVKPTDLKDNGEDIAHALGAAFNSVMKARVYPAYDMDYGISSNATAIGCVPYGGITQLDPSLDLEGMYANGKLSLPGYKVLKAWRDYGLMNIDQINVDVDHHGGMMIYSSTTDEDWKDASNSKYNVPFSNGSQGIAAVEKEILGVVNGDSFFGLSGPTKVYVTTPVVKKTSYDADVNGEITNDDISFINENIGNVITIDNVECDINKDGKITERDAELVTNYLAGQNPHTPKEYAITTKHAYAADWTGNVRVATSAKTVENKTGNNSQPSTLTHYVPEGETYSVAAFPANGFVFAGWANEELAGVTSNVINVKATEDKYYSAKFKRAPAVKVILEKNEDGEGTIGYSEEKTGSYSNRAYGTLNDVKYANFQCAFKATPAEGYVFESWEVTSEGETKVNHSNVLNAYINADTTIKVNFKKASAYDVFNSLDKTVWKTAVASGSGGFTPSQTTLYASVSGGVFYFTNPNLDKMSEYVVINDNALSLGNVTYITTAKTLNKENGNVGRVVFGYKDAKNYWFVEFSGKTDVAKLIQKLNGKFITHATYTPDDESTLDFSNNAEVHITTTSDGKVTAYIYQGENIYILAENYDAGTTITGKMGYGVKYASHITFDNFAVLVN